ncbi:hypothetical protein AMELA_G00052860, partial [Ameiurus melas]
MKVLSVVVALVALWRISVASRRHCPDLTVESCECAAERSRALNRRSARVTVTCDDADLTDTLEPHTLLSTTASLILSNNKISTVKNASFFSLRSLERLDLSNNLISTVEPGAFCGLAMLKRLDLSNNRIGCLSADIFLDLGNLSKLNLSGNIFSTLPEGLFMHLSSLRVLHFSTDYLYCDCQLEWLLLWVRARSVRVGNETACVYPLHLHGFQVRGLQEHQLTCDNPLELPLLQLIPSQRQLVFRGDRLPLQCTASYLDPSITLSWSHNHWPVH